MALVRTSRWRRATVDVLCEQALAGARHEDAARECVRLFSEVDPAGWPVTVVLSGELVRLWQVTPPPAATRPSDLEAAAALRFQSLFGASAAGWKIVASCDAQWPFLAAAVPLELLDGLAQLARAHRFHLVGIVPQFVAALNQWRKQRRPGAWFASVDGGVLTVAAFDGERLAAVRSVALPDGADRAWLDSVVAREALRAGLAPPARVQVCGRAPAGWAAQPGGDSFACSLLDAGTRHLSAPARLATTGAGS
jgi:hypothetical protein